MRSVHDAVRPRDFDNFARWALGSVVVNTHRGWYAEWLVANALGGTPLREEWAACDVITPDGLTVEVKCTGNVQAWEPKPHSKPFRSKFDIEAKKRWLGYGNAYTDNAVIVAHAYVFAVHRCDRQARYDLSNSEQWRFYVVSGRNVENWYQRTSIALSVLRTAPGVTECDLNGLPTVVPSVADAPEGASQIDWDAHQRLSQRGPVIDTSAL